PLRGPQEGSLRQGCRAGLVFVLWVLTLSAATAEERAGGQAIGRQGPLITSDDVSAEVNLLTPTRYAIVLHEPIKLRTIHTRNDILFDPRDPIRSEEHTSELQSRFDLVCRLLLEKKNT